jgi:subfamily B ATP-binding cassette protein MsbA
VAGLTEGFGIALFMPVLAKTNITADSSDKVSAFFNSMFQFLGFSPTIQAIFILILLTFLFKGLIKFGEGAYKAYLTAAITHDIRNHIVRKFEEMSYRYYIDSNTGFLSNLITLESSRAVASFNRYCNVLIEIITIAVFIGFSFWINWGFTITTIIFGASTLYLLKTISRSTRRYSLQTSSEYATLHSMLIQSLQAFKYMKATHAFNTLGKKLFNTINNLSRLQYKTQLLGSIIGALTEPLVVFFIIGLMFYQVVIAKESLAPIIVSIMFFYRIFQHIMGLQKEWQMFSTYIGGIETVSTASKEIEEHKEECGTTHLEYFNSTITFQNVGFAYGDKKVLHNITFSIKKDSTVAFVGESGVGKTTLVDIITSILIPQQGRVIIDEIPIQEINYTDWRKRIGYVTQEPVLFDSTVANNISLWSCDAREKQCLEKIQKAARQAHCDYFIHELSGKYQAIIGDRGIKLSSGQRQRLAIARELFKEPELLILDEATSALDTESELHIQKSIHELKGKMTVILIAHRLSTIRNADYIYVLSDSRIVEEGTFDELMEDEGSEFRRMCELQNIQSRQTTQE